jgi:hypothetical protein
MDILGGGYDAVPGLFGNLAIPFINNLEITY